MVYPAIGKGSGSDSGLVLLFIDIFTFMLLDKLNDLDLINI